jgi:DNA sulfur modification protein DndD
MGTFIKSISLQNFYNYYGSYEDNTYTFKEGINIINADNNMGKSKLYNGFLWILDDQVYDSDDKRYYPVSESYNKMMSKKASRENVELDMGVTIVYESEGVCYKVSKEVHCKSEDGSWFFSPSTNVLMTTDNEDMPVMDKQKQQDAIRMLIPADMEKYALLQGESMERLVDLSTLNGLENTINALADINNLIRMCGLASELVKQAKQEYNKEETKNRGASNEILKLREERDNLEKWIEDANKKIELARQELIKAKEKEQQYESEFFSSKKRIQLRHEYEEECAKLDSLKREKAEQELSITSRLFDENCPWILMGLGNETGDFDANRIELTKKITAQEISQNPQILLPDDSPDAPSLRRMLENEHCEVCDREAKKGTAPWLHIKKVLERPHKEMRTSASFMQFYSGLQNATGRYEATIPQIQESFEQYMNNIYDLDDQIEAQERIVEAKENELTLVGIENSTEEEDRKVLSGYNQAKQTISSKNDEIQKWTGKIKIWDSALTKAKEELDKRQGSTPIRKAKELYDNMQVIKTMFDSTRERIFKTIVDNLQTAANEMYSDLTKGNQTFGGTLTFDRLDDGTVRVSVIDSQGEELYGNGTGFQRMKQLAIVMSIISSKVGNKSFDYPFISDAPFSEFSWNFMNNFFEIAPNVFRQSIIMIKDLYDPADDNLINEHGKAIVKQMNDGQLQGSFYVNYAETRADAGNLVTKKYCYTK